MGGHAAVARPWGLLTHLDAVLEGLDAAGGVQAARAALDAHCEGACAGGERRSAPVWGPLTDQLSAPPSRCRPGAPHAWPRGRRERGGEGRRQGPRAVAAANRPNSWRSAAPARSGLAARAGQRAARGPGGDPAVKRPPSVPQHSRSFSTRGRSSMSISTEDISNGLWVELKGSWGGERVLCRQAAPRPFEAMLKFKMLLYNAIKTPRTPRAHRHRAVARLERPALRPTSA
jgi:hypothetical protein